MTVDTLMDEIESHCLKIGHFDRVNRHEPKNAPGRGLTAAIWVERLDPVRGGSGLDATTMRLEFMIRIYSNMLQEPPDAIDPEILKATMDLMESYTGEFTLRGEVMDIDLLGRYGNGLSSQSGYLTIDNKVYRVMTLRVPVILDNIWDQES